MPAATSPAVPAGHEALEIAVRVIDRQIQDDRCYPDLSELLAVPAPGGGGPALSAGIPGNGRGSKQQRLPGRTEEPLQIPSDAVSSPAPLSNPGKPFVTQIFKEGNQSQSQPVQYPPDINLRISEDDLVG